jgi:hypothetical protein
MHATPRPHAPRATHTSHHALALAPASALALALASALALATAHAKSRQCHAFLKELPLMLGLNTGIHSRFRIG